MLKYGADQINKLIFKSVRYSPKYSWYYCYADFYRITNSKRGSSIRRPIPYNA